MDHVPLLKKIGGIGGRTTVFILVSYILWDCHVLYYSKHILTCPLSCQIKVGSHWFNDKKTIHIHLCSTHKWNSQFCMKLFGKYCFAIWSGMTLRTIKKKKIHISPGCVWNFIPFPIAVDQSQEHIMQINPYLISFSTYTQLQYNYYLFTRLNLDDVIRSVKLTTFLKYWYQINWLVFCIS